MPEAIRRKMTMKIERKRKTQGYRQNVSGLYTKPSDEKLAHEWPH